MFKALIKKQLREFATANGRRKRSKKSSTKGIIAAYSIIFVLLFLFFTFLSLICSTEMLGSGKDWTFYSFVGIIGLILAVFVSVVSTFGGLYMSKDNDLLLSLPIPTHYIVLSRIVTAYLLVSFFTLATFFPAIIVGWIYRAVSFTSIVFPLLILIASTFFVLACSCIIGWVIAFIASKFKGKNFVVAIIGAVVIVGYIFFSNNLIQSLRYYLLNSDSGESLFKSWWNPFYLIGEGAAGDIVSLLIFVISSAIIFGLVILILTRSFYGIISSNKGKSTKKLKAKGIGKQESVSKTLLRKELIHYTKSSVYMLNTGIGVIIMIVLTIILMVKFSDFADAIPQLETILPQIIQAIPLALALVICLISSFGGVSVCSISLEGDRLWLLKSLPVENKKILASKRNLHMLIIGVPAVICSAVLNIYFNTDVITSIVSVIFVWFTILFQAEIGLVLDLKRPHLNWTSETVPVKQNLNVLFVMLIGLAYLIVFGMLIIFGVQILGARFSALIALGLIVIISLLVNKWLSTKGATIFARL